MAQESPAAIRKLSNVVDRTACCGRACLNATLREPFGCVAYTLTFDFCNVDS